MWTRFAVFSVFLLAGCLHVSTAFAAGFAGTVTRLRGEVTATNDAGRRALAANSDVFAGDRITTGDNARLEVRLHDGSVVTLGQRTVFSVREYRYNEGEARVHTVLELIDGAFRSVTGGVFKSQPQNTFEVRTSVAVIGARGTDFWGGHDKGFWEIALLGGTGIYVENEKGRVEISTPGVGTDVKAGEAPTPPKRWAAERIERALKTVAWD
jgi:hypothetical protein